MTIEWLEAESAIDERLSLKDALATLKNELTDDPTNAEVALKLLNVMDQLEVPAPEMAESVEPAMTANPKNPALMAWLGQLSYRLGQVKVGMLTLKHVMEIDPDDVLANFTLGQMMLYAGAFEDGLKYARKAWDLGQDTHYIKEIARLYCILLARLKRFEEAFQFQQKQLESRPDDTQTLIDTADLMGEMGRSGEAQRMLIDAQAEKPSDVDLLFRISVGYFENEKVGQGLFWADKVIDADAQHLEGWNLRAQIKFKLGDYEGALGDHEMISELSKSMPLDQSFRASCFEKMGCKQDAINALRQGIQECKDWPDRVQHYRAHLDRLTVVPPEQQRRKHNLGPNDPCWCGSGKKLKKCHGG